MLQIINKKQNYICSTKQDEKLKWGNYHDAGYVFSKLAEPLKASFFTQIAVNIANKFNLNISDKLLSFSNLLFYRQYGYYDNIETYELHKQINNYYLDKTKFN